MDGKSTIVTVEKRPYIIISPGARAYTELCAASADEAVKRAEIPMDDVASVVEIDKRDANHTHDGSGDCIVAYNDARSRGADRARIAVTRALVENKPIYWY